MKIWSVVAGIKIDFREKPYMKAGREVVSGLL